MNKPIIKILASTFLLIIGFVGGTFYNKSNDEPKNEIVSSGSDFEMIQEYLSKHWDHMKELWSPFSNTND